MKKTSINGLVDGYIISPPIHSEEQIQALVRSRIPYVLIDRYFPEMLIKSVLVL